MAFSVGRFSNVNFGTNKQLFGDFLISHLAGSIKNLTIFSPSEIVILFKLFIELSNNEKNSFNLTEEELNFINKFYGTIN